MPVIAFNKTKTITNSDAYNLAADLLTLASSMPVTIPVASQAERDGLAALAPGGTLPNPTFVMRTDLQGYPTFRWDGGVWTQTSGLMHAEYTGPAFTTAVATGTNFGGPSAVAFIADGAKTFNNTFVQPDIGGRIKILAAGVYALQGIILPASVVPGSYSIAISDITNAAVIASNGGVGYGDKEQSITAPNFYCAANTVIQFNITTSNAITLGSRTRITKVQ